MFPKKPFSKISTEHLECSYDYHDGKIRQKAKKTSLRVQERRKFFLLKVFPWTRRMKFCQTCPKPYTVSPNVLLKIWNCWERSMFSQKIFLTSMNSYHTHVDCKWKSRRKRNWKKAEKKLLNVQNCWNFICRKPFFLFFVPMDTKNANLTTLLQFFNWKLKRFCSMSQIDEQKQNTSQIPKFL